MNADRDHDTQPRERAVPCRDCGYTMRSGLLSPRTMTWNTSGLCDTHEVAEKPLATVSVLRWSSAQADAERAEEAQRSLEALWAEEDAKRTYVLCSCGYERVQIVGEPATYECGLPCV